LCDEWAREAVEWEVCGSAPAAGQGRACSCIYARRLKWCGLCGAGDEKESTNPGEAGADGGAAGGERSTGGEEDVVERKNMLVFDCEKFRKSALSDVCWRLLVY